MVSKRVRMCIDDCKVIQVQVFFLVFFLPTLLGYAKLKEKKLNKKQLIVLELESPHGGSEGAAALQLW